MIDTRSEFGKRVERRLHEERIGWFTTVDAQGAPQPRPVWFLWDGEQFLIYSRPNTHKLRHVANNAQVALHLDGDGHGGDIIVFTGEAVIDRDAPPADQVSEYVDKYQSGFQRIGMTTPQFAEVYSVAIRMRPDKLRGH